MEKYEIQADRRHMVRSVQTAMQGNAIRALVELITNSDDSYCDLEDFGNKPSGLIEILYRKDGYSCHFAVRVVCTEAFDAHRCFHRSIKLCAEG